MTTNAGAQSIIEPKKLGFATVENEKADYNRMKSNVMEEVRRIFKPEFLNRLDDVIMFRPLTIEQIGKIVDLQLEQLVRRLQNRQLHLHISEAAKDLLTVEGYDPAFGARPLRRLIQREIGDQLAKQILAGKITDGDTVRVDVADLDTGALEGGEREHRLQLSAERPD